MFQFIKTMGDGMGLLSLDLSFDDSYDSKCFIEGKVIPGIMRLREDGEACSALYLGNDLGAVISHPGDRRKHWSLFSAMGELKEFEAFCQGTHKVLFAEKPYDMELLYSLYRFAYKYSPDTGSVVADNERMSEMISKIEKTYK